METKEGLGKRVHAALLASDADMSPLQLAHVLKAKKQLVNRELYALQDVGLAKKTRESGPPLWHGCPVDSVSWTLDIGMPQGQEGTFRLYIDLDHVHDCFERASKCAQTWADLHVTGYCGPAYNHWTPPSRWDKNKHVTMVRATEPLKDVAELMMFRDVLLDSRGDEQRAGKFTYILGSKDKSVHTMAQLLRDDSVEVVVVQQGWDELKMYLE